MKTVEYRVRPVTRYIVTRYDGGDGSPPSTEVMCVCDNEFQASRVAAALRSQPKYVRMPEHVVEEPGFDGWLNTSNHTLHLGQDRN